jgi:glycosyltransferase involved in cell wall biosynthesis
MKVLIITNLCHGYAATLPERCLYKGLVSMGTDLTIISHFCAPETMELESAGIKIIYLPIRRKFDRDVIRTLRRIIIEEQIEILHITFGKALTNALFASYGLPCKIVAYLGSVRLYWHDPFSWISFLNPRVDRLICLSRGVEEHVLKQAPRRMKGRTIMIYKGYETSWFRNIIPAEKKSLGIPPEGFIISCVANVRKVKGIPWLIKASDRLPENLPIYFLLIGPGMDSEEIKNLVGKSKYRNNFRTFGFTNNVFPYTAACDLYIQPSLTEGLGRSVMEAMCLAKPIIVTGKGGVRELVDEGITGFYIPSPTASAIAERIIWCYENRTLLPEMGIKGKNKIETGFRTGPMIEKTFQLYRSLVHEQ